MVTCPRCGANPCACDDRCDCGCGALKREIVGQLRALPDEPMPAQLEAAILEATRHVPLVFPREQWRPGDGA